MAIPLIALGYATARVLGQRALAGRLASSVARSALLAGRASAVQVAKKKPLPLLLPVFGPDFGWYPLPDVLPKHLLFSPEGFANLGPWTRYASASSIDGSYTGAYGRNSQSNTANSSLIASQVSSGLLLQGVIAGTVGDPFSGLSNNARSISVGKTKLVFGSPRMQLQIAYTRPNQGPFTKPHVRPAAVIPLHIAGKIAPVYPSRNLDNGLRSYSPQSLPIQNYAPPPQSLPYDAIVPARRLYPYMPGAPYFEQPSSPDSEPGSPSRPSRPSEVPLEEPRSEFPARDVPLARGHMRRPPIRGQEKEVKVRRSRPVAALMAAAGVVTEALEVLDVLYKSLPSSKKPRYEDTGFAWKNPPPHIKARAVYDNFSSIDASSAISGYLQNQIEDILIGRAARGVRRNQLAADPNRPLGWLSGPAL